MKGPKAEFFDIFGVFVFAIITGIALWGLNSSEPLPKWMLFTLLFIGVAGLIIDSSTVSRSYFKKK